MFLQMPQLVSFGTPLSMSAIDSMTMVGQANSF